MTDRTSSFPLSVIESSLGPATARVCTCTVHPHLQEQNFFTHSAAASLLCFFRPAPFSSLAQRPYVCGMCTMACTATIRSAVEVSADAQRRAALRHPTSGLHHRQQFGISLLAQNLCRSVSSCRGGQRIATKSLRQRKYLILPILTTVVHVVSALTATANASRRKSALTIRSIRSVRTRIAKHPIPPCVPSIFSQRLRHR